jgi:hypothetical protein
VDSRFDSSIRVDDGRYTTVVRVMLDGGAASGRFVEATDGEESAEDAATDGEQTAEAEGAER